MFRSFEFDKYPVRLTVSRPPRIAQPEAITETWYKNLKKRGVSDHLIFGGDAIRRSFDIFGDILVSVPVSSRERATRLFRPKELPIELLQQVQAIGASTVALIERRNNRHHVIRKLLVPAWYGKGELLEGLT